MWSGTSRSGEPSRTITIATRVSPVVPLGSRHLHALAALAWEFWASNRRGWQILMAAMVGCALLLRFMAGPLQGTETLRFLCFLPMVMSLILAAAFCNFTDRDRRDGIAGFPRHLFTLPLGTSLMVTLALAFSLLSVVGIYAAWVIFVLRPVQFETPLRWPATLLAAFVVFYQTIVWCLCGFRLTRIISLSIVATTLVGVAFLPTLNPQSGFLSSESNLSVTLLGLMATAYGVTLVVVGAQRRGGARGWPFVAALVDSITSAIPRRQSALGSPEAALFWLEWRRAGLVLPTAVIITMIWILGPVLWFTGRDGKETLWAEMWLAIMPMILAFPVGMGFGKPDLWSLDLSLSSFVATRPITAAQLASAKLRTAAWSTFVAWAVVLIVAPVWIYFCCDTKHWSHIWQALETLYSPVSRWAVPLLLVVAAVLITWSLLVSSIWLGYSGRPGFYYSLSAIGLSAFVAGFIYLLWWLDHPRGQGDILVGMLPWLPWALAVFIAIKAWFAMLAARELRRRGLVSARDVIAYSCVWLGATACLVLCAWLMAPRIEWFRNTMMLVGLSIVPVGLIAVAPLTIAWNRHR
jgi:hypothetical protein